MRALSPATFLAAAAAAAAGVCCSTATAAAAAAAAVGVIEAAGVAFDGSSESDDVAANGKGDTLGSPAAVPAAAAAAVPAAAVPAAAICKMLRDRARRDSLAARCTKKTTNSKTAAAAAFAAAAAAFAAAAAAAAFAAAAAAIRMYEPIPSSRDVIVHVRGVYAHQTLNPKP